MTKTEIPGDDTSTARNNLYLRVATFLLCLIVINVALAWILQFYFNDSVIGYFSFTGHDPSWIPKGTTFAPALGVHYFGDFEQYMGYAVSSIPPYSSSIGVPAAYGPFAVVLLKFIHYFAGWPGSVFVFLTGSTILLFWGFLRLIGPSISARILVILLFCTGGMIISFDRGNLQILVIGLCVWFCVGYLEDRSLILILSLAFAIAIKIYVAVLLLELIRQRRWRDLSKILGLSCTIYAISFALLGGGFIQSIRDFFDTNVLFASSPSHDFVLGCVSAASAVYKTLWLLWGPQHFGHFLSTTPGWFIQVPGIAIGLACLVIVWFSKYPRELALVALLAMMQLAPASTYPYLMVNMLVELCLLLRILGGSATSSEPDHPLISRRILITCIGFLVVGSAPWAGMFYGKMGASTPIVYLVGPIANVGVVLALLVGLVLARRPVTKHRHASGRSSLPESEGIEADHSPASFETLATEH